jgi:hypothetical protein
MSKIESLAELVIAIILAWVCNRWIESLRVEATQDFSIASFLWIAGFLYLLMAIVSLLLAWQVIFRSSRSKLVSSVFVIVGLGITFTSAITMSTASTLPPLGIAEFLYPGSLVLFVAAFVAAIGIAAFVLPKRFSN